MTRNWPIVVAIRIVRLALLLAAVAVAAFALTKASPVDPVQAYLGPAIAKVGPEQRDLIAQKWGLDQPPLTQFGKWLDIWRTYFGQMEVMEEIVQGRVPHDFSYWPRPLTKLLSMAGHGRHQPS